MHSALAIWLLVSLLGCASLSQVEVLMLADIHLDLFYKPDSSTTVLCRESTIKAESEAPLGRVGCDTPLILLNQVLLKASSIVKPKFVLINGDSVAHMIPLQYGRDSLLETLEVVIDLVSRYFPEAVILPSIGNNDVFQHSNVPRRQEAKEYYSLLYEFWFGDYSAARNNVNLLDAEQEQQFKFGGYYSVKVNDNLEVLAFNSIHYYIPNDPARDPEGAEQQMQWLESKVANAEEGMKFILFYHVNVGTDTFGSYSWHQDYQSRFLDLQKKYSDRILVDWVAHIHEATFRGYSEANTGTVYGAALHSPAVTPVYDNNPGFRVYTLEEGSDSTFIKGYHDYSLQLEMLKPVEMEEDIDFQNMGLVWNEIFTNQFLGISELSPQSIQDFWKRILTDEKAFDAYLLQQGGFDNSQLDEVKERYGRMFDVNFPTSMAKNWSLYCKMMCPGYKNYADCLNNPRLP